ncbi:DUF887-domain-containing protein [Schizopora paradoxa]|uniref:DUF887-domain-containing protein n=1 Tax=Schizopora paradoxa TaxID=27342 RepID=A0A0H2RM77_9AGAM|nr:DUF887-domain-containing protein [Schizopora paradoxa]
MVDEYGDPYGSASFLRASLRSAAAPIADTLGFKKLADHFDVVVLSALFFWSVQCLWSPFVSRAFFKSYTRLPTSKARNNWNVHVVSLLHSIVIIPLAIRCLDSNALDEDRAFGWDDHVGSVLAISLGYFAWDTIESIYHFSGVGFVAHGFACFVIYSLSFKPFVAYYGPRFLLWELSTPFLNINWFLDKMDMSGSLIQVVNGALLLLSFAGARLFYGTIMSIAFYHTLIDIKDQLLLSTFLVYFIGNTVLNGLNWFWFSKMIAMVRKRIAGRGKERKD